MTFINSLSKQYNTGPYIGLVRALFTQVQFYVGLVQFSMIAVLAWDGVIGEKLISWFPWMTFTTYVLAGVAGYVLLMLFEWKVVLPSGVRLANQQAYKHDNPIRRDIEALNLRLKAIEGAIIELSHKDHTSHVCPQCLLDVRKQFGGDGRAKTGHRW